MPPLSFHGRLQSKWTLAYSIVRSEIIFKLSHDIFVGVCCGFIKFTDSSDQDAGLGLHILNWQNIDFCYLDRCFIRSIACGPFNCNKNVSDIHHNVCCPVNFRNGCINGIGDFSADHCPKASDAFQSFLSVHDNSSAANNEHVDVPSLFHLSDLRSNLS